MAPPPQLFGIYRCFIIVCIYVLTVSSTYSVKLTIEKPTIQRPSVTKPDILQVETFDRLKTGRYQVYETRFGNSSYKGVYHNVRIQSRDYWGGAEGKGFYPVAYEWSRYRLTIIQSGTIGPNYFGLWISSLDVDNRLEFYYRGNRIYALNTKEVHKLMRGSFGYRGNPTYWFRLPVERYVFLNFCFSFMSYDEIRFIAQANRFESDNHIVGYHKRKFVKATPASTTTTSTLPTSVPTLPTTTPELISTEEVIPESTTSTSTLPASAPTLPTPTPGPTSIAAVVAVIIMFLVGAGVLIFFGCRRLQSARPSVAAAAKKPSGPSSVAATKGEAVQREPTEREVQVEWDA